MTDRHIFIHDGSFPGFLCATAELLNAVTGRSTSPSIDFFVYGPCRTVNLFENAEIVLREDARARRLWERLGSRIGAESRQTIMEAFLSDTEDADEAAAAMTVRLWKEGRQALNDLTDPHAAIVEKAAGRTTREAHRFLGLVRFAELSDGSWYSAIEPDCDILHLIAGHFADRFPLMAWAIHDIRRKSAVLRKPGHSWIVVDGFEISAYEGARPDGYRNPPVSDAEAGIQNAWRQYFSAIAIENRKNSRLQTSFLPKKHQKHLPEMNQSVTALFSGSSADTSGRHDLTVKEVRARSIGRIES